MRILGGGVICLSFGFGYKLSYSSWDEKVSISRHKSLYSRGLASVEGATKIETVSNSFLDSQNLFDQARHFSKDGKIIFYVGNLISKDLKGNKNFVCDVYSQVHFYFEADGIFQRGEPVTMTIHSSCKTDENNHSIGPFFIPVQEILKSSVSQKNFPTREEEVDTVNSDHSEHIHPKIQKHFSITDGDIFFNNIAISWPRSWILMEVTFQSASQDQYRVEARIPQTEDETFFTIDF